jgi:sigma-B regulation protein RsbU (phosphoserine phosphatase)
MFVTVFAGILDLRDGTVEYADGGHEPPYIVRASGGASMIDKIGGLALGFIPGYEFRPGRIQLAPGDSLILYTDGITEAMNTGHELFGADRIEEILDHAVAGISAQTLSKTLLGGVAAFVGGAHQSDDLTLLVLRYGGNRTELPLDIAQQTSAAPA